MQYNNARSPESFVYPSHMDTNNSNNNNAINLEDTLVWATCHKYLSAHTLQQKQNSFILCGSSNVTIFIRVSNLQRFSSLVHIMPISITT